MSIPGYFRSSGAEVILPTLASSIGTVPGAAAWPANWTQVLAAGLLATDYLLTDADTAFQFTAFGAVGTPGQAAQFEIGVGGVGAEVPIAHGAAAMGGLQVLVGGADIVYGTFSMTIPFKPVRIPALSRIAVRACNFNQVTGVGVYLKGYTSWDAVQPVWPGLDELAYAQGASGVRSRVYPDAGETAVVSGGAGYVLGAWTGPVVTTAVPTLVKGVAARAMAMTAPGFPWQIEVGMKTPAMAPGTQVVVARTSFARCVGGPTGGLSTVARPFLAGAGQELYLRAASSGVVTFNAQLLLDEFL